MSSDFYTTSIVPFAPIIIKICRAYTNTQEDFEDYYQEVCLQIWRSHRTFDERAAWSTWIYRVSLNVCMTLLKTHKRNRRIFASDVVPPSSWKTVGRSQTSLSIGCTTRFGSCRKWTGR